MTAKLLFSLLFFFTSTSALTLTGSGDNPTEFIRASCGATLYPALCFNSLARYACAVQQNPVQLARVAANITLARVRSLSAHVSSLRRAPVPGGPEAAALRDCAESLGDAVDQTRRSAEELARLEAAVGPEVARRISNVQTWMSAALTNEDTCADGFDGVGPSPVKADVCGQVRRAKEYTSITLALVNSLVASRWI